MTFEPTISSPNAEKTPSEGQGAAPGYDMPPEPGMAPSDATAAPGDAVSAEPAPEYPAGWTRNQAPVGKDVFFENFKGLISAPNAVLVLKRQAPLQTLMIADDNLAARRASDAIYDICLETPWLNFFLAEDSKWAERALAIGAFFVPLVSAAGLELKMRNRPAPPAKTDQAETDQAERPKPPAREPGERPIKAADFGAEPAAPEGEPDDAAPPADDGTESVLEVNNG